MEIVTARTR